jgi:hypothetical protein
MSCCSKNVVTTALFAGLVIDNAVDDGTLNKVSVKNLVDGLGLCNVVKEIKRLQKKAIDEIVVQVAASKVAGGTQFDYRAILASADRNGIPYADVGTNETALYTAWRAAGCLVTGPAYNALSASAKTLAATANTDIAAVVTADATGAPAWKTAGFPSAAGTYAALSAAGKTAADTAVASIAAVGTDLTTKYTAWNTATNPVSGASVTALSASGQALAIRSGGSSVKADTLSASEQIDLLVTQYLYDHMFNMSEVDTVDFTPSNIKAAKDIVDASFKTAISWMAISGAGSDWNAFIGNLVPANLFKYTNNGNYAATFVSGSAVSSLVVAPFPALLDFANFASTRCPKLGLSDWIRALSIEEALQYVDTSSVITTDAQFAQAYALASTTIRDVADNWTNTTTGVLTNEIDVQQLGAFVRNNLAKYNALKANIALKLIQDIYSDYCGLNGQDTPTAPLTDYDNIVSAISALSKFVSGVGLLTLYYSDPSVDQTDDLYLDLDTTGTNNVKAFANYNDNEGNAITVNDGDVPVIQGVTHDLLIGANISTANNIVKYLTLNGLELPTASTDFPSADNASASALIQWPYFLNAYFSNYKHTTTTDLNIIYDAMVILATPLANSALPVDEIIMSWFGVANPSTTTAYGVGSDRAKVAIGDVMMYTFTLYSNPANTPIIKTMINFKLPGAQGNDNLVVDSLWVSGPTIEPLVIAPADQHTFLRKELNASISAQMTYFILYYSTDTIDGEVDSAVDLCQLASVFTMENILAAKSNYTPAVGPVIQTVLNGTQAGLADAPLFSSPAAGSVFSAVDGSFTAVWAAIIANLLSDAAAPVGSAGRLADLTNAYFGSLSSEFKTLFVATPLSTTAFNTMITNLLDHGLVKNIVGTSSKDSLMIALANWAATNADGPLDPNGQVSDLTATLDSAQAVTIKRVVTVLAQAVASGLIQNVGELQYFTQFFYGQQQIIMVNYVATRSIKTGNNLTLPEYEFNALIVNGLMEIDQLLSAVYIRYDIRCNKVGALERYVYVHRDDEGRPCFTGHVHH